MEENVALDSSKQNQFVKSIKGIKKILKKKDKSKSKKENKNVVQIGKIKKPARKKRGLVYLSHIPHGFYEHQMTEYFKQFGVVTNARVIRSKRTGMSKGHAFVEFKDLNVAEIVAETMNNYLMGKRLIKAVIIPPKEQRKFSKRKHWNAQHNPGNILRKKMRKAHNSVKDENEDLQIAKKLLSNLNKTKKRLRELGIDYDFFTPVDIPEALLKQDKTNAEEDVKSTDLIKNEDKVKVEENVSSTTKKTKRKKANDSEIKSQEPSIPTPVDSSANKKLKNTKQNQSSDDTSNLDKESKGNIKNSKASKAEKNMAKQLENKEVSRNVEKNKKNNTQTEKEKKLKNMGVKQPENFIKIQKSDTESDSSVNFDSDEYDKVIEEGDSDVESDYETDEDLDEDVTSEEDASDNTEKKQESGKTKIQATQIKTKQQDERQNKKSIANKPLPQPMKRKPQNNAKPSKKSKLEKKEDAQPSKKPKLEKKEEVKPSQNPKMVKKDVKPSQKPEFENKEVAKPTKKPKFEKKGNKKAMNIAKKKNK